MIQKNIFTLIGVVLAIQGIAFYFMASNVVSSAFPNLDEAGKEAPIILMQVMAVMSFTLGLVAYGSRNAPGVLWAFLIGFALFTIVSLKHLFVDDISVPVPAIIIQICIVLACGYLIAVRRNTKSV